jgi:hypothetical protein
MIDLTVLLWVLIVLAYVGLCYLVGRFAVDGLTHTPGPLVIAGAPLLGAALLALQLWLYGVVRVPWNALSLLLPWVVLAAVRRDRVMALLDEERQRLARLRWVLSSLSIVEMVLVAAGVLVVLAYLLNLIAKPLIAWDAIDAWLFKAKLYYGQQAVDLHAVSQDVSRSLDYPPLFSLMVASLYTLIGQASDLLGKAVTFIFVVVSASVGLAALSRWLNRPLAITFTFVLITLPLFAPALLTGAYMGYADYSLGVCMMISLVFLYDGETGGKPQAYAFAVVFAAMAALMKNEGLVFLVIVTALLAIHLVTSGRLRMPVRRDWPILALLLVAVWPIVAWRAYVYTGGLTHSLSQVRVAEDLPLLPERASVILSFLGKMPSLSEISTAAGMIPTTVADAPWLAISFLLSGVLLAANRFRSGTLIYAAIGLQLLSYIVVYLFASIDLTTYLATTGDRVLIQLAPSDIVMLAIALRPHLATDHQTISRRTIAQYALSTAPPNRTIG